MLRIYCLQQWFNLSDPPAEDAICDCESMRCFARVELGGDTVPDETTILRFRHLLEAAGSDQRGVRRRSVACSKRAAFCRAPEPSSMRRSPPHRARSKTKRLARANMVSACARFLVRPR
jgi:Transposase domain (DUF772)